MGVGSAIWRVGNWRDSLDRGRGAVGVMASRVWAGGEDGA